MGGEHMAAKIGRFEIVRMLGKGAQGIVYLARDSHLDRDVAIKTLHATQEGMGALIQEARIVSKLQHGNIVTLFDAGEHEGAPYLVYAYVQGQTLAHLLQAEPVLPLTRAVQIVSSLLEALAYAHEQGVLHLDIKPANIMLNASGQPQIMDFGIARSISQPSPARIDGSPHYMAPEMVAGKKVTPRADIYSLGMVLYTLVTGQPAVEGDDVQEVLRKTLQEATTAPSERNIHVDAQLEAIILKALAKNPDDRYANATAMNQALQQYLDPTREDEKSAHDSKHSTLEFLLRRMRSKSDFPILSSTLSEINRVVDDESASTNILTKTILQDFALTNKLLRLVNTVTYGQFGGKINTISKAVVILGFETVRNVAMTLILFEFLQNKAQAAQLKDDVLSSYFAGILAAQFSSGRNIRDAEEAMICSMFRNLGKLLATFYFFEESQEVARLVEQGDSEDKAAVKVLGMGYSELGVGVAKSWNFPPRLLAGMQRLVGEVIKPYGELETLTVTVNLANELCAVIAHGNAEQQTQGIRNIMKRYKNAVAITEPQLRAAIESSLAEMSARAGIVSVNLAQSALMKKMRQWAGEEEMVAKEQAPEVDSMAGITRLDMGHIAEGGDMDEERHDADAILSAGIQDVTNTLVEEHQLNDIMQMVLETMHRGMEFQRTIICVRDAKHNVMAARFGFGKDAEAMLPKFRFPLNSTPDVFQIALSKAADLSIADINAPNIADKIPAWYRAMVSAGSLLLLPIVIKGKPIALFYADMPAANSMQISQRQLSLLRTLRNQAVLAIRQKM
jgi:eukaryotic-like serine/threonine-protein kinase